MFKHKDEMTIKFIKLYINWKIKDLLDHSSK